MPRQSGRRRWPPGAAAAAMLALAACGVLPRPAGEIGFIDGFAGGVIADEPRAALVGRDVLSAGGSAADAVVAAYFTMAVTMPGAAGLGSGGVCLGYDPELQQVDSLEFLPAPMIAAGSLGVAVPGSIRGMFALHARYGRLPWGSVLQSAETLARQGHTVSRAFATELQKIASVIAADPATQAIFGRADGGLVGEGQQIRQVELAAVLSVLRLRGPGEFYGGALGRQFAEAVASLGGAMTVADLRRYRPRLGPTIQIPAGNSVLHFSPLPTLGGATAAQLWATLAQDGVYDRASLTMRPHLFAEASLRAFADRSAWPQNAAFTGPQELVAPARIEALLESYDKDRHVPAADLDPAPIAHPQPSGGAAVVAVDRDGQAMACAFTLNQPFGIGRVAPGTGILVAAPSPAARPSTPIALVLGVNQNVDTLTLAAAAVGGAPAATALTSVLLDTLERGEPLTQALAEPRLHHGGAPDVVLHEATFEAAGVEALKARGHQTRGLATLGRVSALYCPGGLPRQPLCQFATDPRGFGLAAATN